MLNGWSPCATQAEWTSCDAMARPINWSRVAILGLVALTLGIIFCWGASDGLRNSNESLQDTKESFGSR